MPKHTTCNTAVASVLLRLPQVRARTGLSRSELYRRIANGAFPAPVKIGVRASAWSSAEIDPGLPSASPNAMPRERLDRAEQCCNP